MAILVQVTVTDDNTGAVKQTFVMPFAGSDSWEVARCMRQLLSRVFAEVFGVDDEWF